MNTEDQTPPTEADTLAAAVIDPIAEWVGSEHGRQATFIKAFQARHHATRNMVAGWIHPDHAKRTMPSLAAGLMLQAVAKTLGVYRKPKEPTAPAAQ